ncbi:MAG: lysophospholipid acyltransferase family protein [Terriglobales bacterium]
MKQETWNSRLRDLLEFAPVTALINLVGLLPRPAARAIGIGISRLAYLAHPRFRRVGLRNLEVAFPAMPASQKQRLLREEFDNLGRLLAEFCLFPRYTRENAETVAIYDGLENYETASKGLRGVLLLTAHLGGWEVGSFVHSLHGNPLCIVIRELDNPHLNRLVDRYRTLHGNRTFGKQEFARGLLAAVRAGETVGLLMDTNTITTQGVFVPFFGVPACTASGLARVALHTGAAVVPAFTIWDKELGKYRIRFEPMLELVRTGDDEADAIANTALFNQVIENFVRRYPGQWLWVHRRWKTRPPGEEAWY